MMTDLLEHPNRPLPKSPTHCLIVDILNRDASLKRVSIYFNPADAWTDPSYSFGQNNPKAVGKLMKDNLRFIWQDEMSLACRCWVVEVKTQTVVHKFSAMTKETPHD